MKKGLFPVILAAFALTASAQTKDSAVKVTDMLKIKSVSGVALNKEGTKAAFTLTCIEPDPESKSDYRYVNHIYLVNTDGSGAPRELTVREGSSQAAWSPDGKQLAFVRLAEGKPQIFIMSIEGGEPYQFTHFKYGAGTPQWSPDGKKIIFSSNIPLKDLLRDSTLNADHALPSWQIEQPGFENNESLKASGSKADPDGSLDEIRAFLDNDVADKKAKVVTRLDFQDEQVVNPDLSFNHFFLQPVHGEVKPVCLTPGFYRFAAVQYTPDGKHLIMTALVDSTTNPDRSLESQVFIADSLGLHRTLLLGEHKAEYQVAALSPSGKWLAYLESPVGFVNIPVLRLMPLDANHHEVITVPLDRTKGNFRWSPDEKYLYFTATSNGGVPLYRVQVATRKVEQLSDFNAGIGSFDCKGGKLVYAKTEVADPSELFVADTGMHHASRLSDFNQEWLRGKSLIHPEKHEFKNDRGMTVEFWVMKPANFVAGKKYPLLLEIHGGPSAMWGPGESSMWHEFQYFCSKGYGVVYCNPRGSGGYGEEFLRANIKDWGTGPTEDVLGALDRAVAEGWADTSRLLVTGGSYAGYLVAWIIGHDHRFKAACSQRGVYDLATFFGEGNAWRLVPEYFGGYPWDSTVKALLQHESPITYVNQITTPYIIFHGENDRRTGFVQGEMMYRSLKVLGRPVEYVRHPGATHEITRSGDNRQRIDQMLRTYEFFQRCLNDKTHS